MSSSSAYVSCVYGGQSFTYHFTGVTEIEHNLALNLQNESAEGADIVNGARKLPNQVTLSVAESDAAHHAGWSANLFRCMQALRDTRTLCRVVTPLCVYESMLLTEITAKQDAEGPEGWTGTLAFMEYVPVAAGEAQAAKENSNSSVRKNTGSSGSFSKLTGTVFQQLLARSGVKM